MIRIIAAAAAALLLALPSSSRAADACETQTERLLHASPESAQYARSWSPLQILLHRPEQQAATAPPEWRRQDLIEDPNEFGSATRWRGARLFAERIFSDFMSACAAPQVRPPSCADASNTLWIPSAASRRLAGDKSPVEVLFAETSPGAAVSEDAARWALSLLHAFATSCPPEDLQPPTGAAFRPLHAPKAEELLARHARGRRFAAPLLPSVLGAPAEVPAPRTLQFTASQLIAGQPAFSATAAGSPGQGSDSALTRRATLAFSLLVVQPTGASDGTSRQPPTLASGEVFAGSTTEHSPFDWPYALARDAQANARALESIQRDGWRELARSYRALAREQPDPLVFQAAAERARARVADAVERYFVAAYVTPMEAANDTIWGCYARVRYTLDATWTPELPDLFNASVGVHASHRLAAGRDTEPSVRGTFSLLAGFSAFPTSEYANVTEATGQKSDRSLLLDGSAGLVVELPDLVGLPSSKLSVAGLARMSTLTRFEYSVGVNLGLVVPVSDNLALDIAYTLRCGPTLQPCISTYGLTLAGSFVP